MQGGGGEGERHVAAFQMGDIQQAVDQRQQPFRAAFGNADDLQGAGAIQFLILGEHVAQDAQPALDRGQRAAQVVHDGVGQLLAPLLQVMLGGHVPPGEQPAGHRAVFAHDGRALLFQIDGLAAYLALHLAQRRLLRVIAQAAPDGLDLVRMAEVLARQVAELAQDAQEMPAQVGP